MNNVPGRRARLRSLAPVTTSETSATASWDRDAWADDVRRLARERDAVILAHNYQLPEIQDIADHVGDSLALSRVAATVDASTIVFCGVHFMAETAKILSYDKTILIPDERAGCSLADTITAEQLRAWKAEHPGAKVVSYVNTTAAVKAETDICCTSSNAVDVVASIDPDTEILFCPDQFLGAHVQRLTGRQNMHIWMGECHVHAGINGADLPRTGGGRARGRVVHPSRVRVRHQRAVPRVVGGRARRADQDPVDVGHGHRGRADHGEQGARGHRDRHAPPVAQGEPARRSSSRSTGLRCAST